MTPLPAFAEDHFLATPDELFERGLCYSTGQGVPQDLVKAHTFFNLAALAGNSRAREMRTEIAQDMTPAEIASAQRLARTLWGKCH
jgi:TPR repeat protein